MHTDWFSDIIVTDHEPSENETHMHDCSSQVCSSQVCSRSVTSTDDACDTIQPDTIMDSDQNIDGNLDDDHERYMCFSPDAMQKSLALFLLRQKNTSLPKQQFKVLLIVLQHLLSKESVV